MYDFSAPVVFTDTVFSPLKWTVRLDGKSNEIGVSSMFPMAARGKFAMFQYKAMEIRYLLLDVGWKLLGNVGPLTNGEAMPIHKAGTPSSRCLEVLVGDGLVFFHSL